MAISTMIIIAAINRYSKIESYSIDKISILASIVLIMIYLLGLFFSLFTHSNLFIISEETEEKKLEKEGVLYLFFLLIVIGILLFFISSKLINSMNYLVKAYNMNEDFLGLVIIPFLGNSGENFSEIIASYKNKINLSLEIAIGSCIQYSMFVIPILVIYSFCYGKTYWLEGAMLLAIYLIIVIAFYFI